MHCLQTPQTCPRCQVYQTCTNRQGSPRSETVITICLRAQRAKRNLRLESSPKMSPRRDGINGNGPGAQFLKQISSMAKSCCLTAVNYLESPGPPASTSSTCARCLARGRPRPGAIAHQPRLCGASPDIRDMSRNPGM